jgi:hypothetical protein
VNEQNLMSSARTSMTNNKNKITPKNLDDLTLIFLYCKVSTLNPIVGIVCTASSLSFCNRYKIVVLPALSKPRMRIRTSLEPKRDSKIRDIMIPIFIFLFFLGGVVDIFDQMMVINNIILIE